MATSSFRYPFDIQSTLEPWRHELGHSFDDVVAHLSDRDRALEDYVDNVIYDRVSQLVTFGGGETINLGAWTTWSPVVTQGVTPTQTINYAKYRRSGRLIVAQASINITSGGTASTAIAITGLPASAATGNIIPGSFRLFSLGNTNYVGTVIAATATTCNLFTNGDGNQLGITTAGSTLKNGDVLQFGVQYEAAS